MAETFNRVGTSLTTTSITDVYQAPNNLATDRAVVVSCMVANKKVGIVSVTLSITDSSNVLSSIWASSVSIPSNASVEYIPNKLFLKRGEKIRATANEANQLEVTVSALEIT
jgi:hypothetical protein